MQNIIKFAKGVYFKITDSVSVNDFIVMLVGVLSAQAVIMYSKAPFGIACGMAYILSGYYTFSVLLPILGYALIGYDNSVLMYIFILLTMALVAKKYKMTKFSLVLLFFMFEFIFILNGVCNIFNIVILILESILIYAVCDVYMEFIKYFSGRTFRRTFSPSEIKSVFTVVLIVMIPLSRMYIFSDVTVAGVISVTVILFCALELDLSLCVLCGCLVGTVMGISNPQMLYCVGSYTVSSVCASLGSKYRKIGAVSGFIIANALMTYYANGSKEVLINIYEVLLASFIFFSVSDSGLRTIGENVMMLLDREKNKEIKRMELFKKETNTKLMKMSGAFDYLSEVLGKFEKRKKKDNSFEMSMLIESVRERVCLSCRNFDYCWKIENDSTFHTIEKLIFAVEKRGWVENYDLSGRFRNSCYFSGKIVLETNKVYELYRVNSIWENKISESRQLISQQLKDMSEAVKGLAKDFEGESKYEMGMENTAISMLDAMGVKVSGVNITAEKNGRFKVKVGVRECKKHNLCERCIEPVLSKVCEKNMKCINKGCFGGNCIVELVEKELFRIETAVSRIRPEKETCCGDSYAVIKPDNERIIVALSDGMGTGDKAAKESLETVNLLERLLTAGIAEETAIKLINSVLILKSYEESFATLDMLIFDLYSGIGEFVKTGGVSSYIKRGDRIIKISADSLPTGIIGTVDPTSCRVSLADGDVVILISDGVSDVSDSDRRIKDYLKNVEQESVKQISDGIIKEATLLLDKPMDDMTVLAIKISSNK